MTVQSAGVKGSVRLEDFAAAPARARMAFLSLAAMKRWAAADAARLSLWAPVAIGLGAGIYFGLKIEPDWRWGAGALLVSAIIALAPTRARVFGATLMLVALGFAAADWRTAQVYAPQLIREIGFAGVTGRIVSIEESTRQRRYVLALESIEGLAPEDMPARARISWRGKAFDAAPGDRVTVRASLSPPPPPVAPGSFDFARQLYFLEIGAVGFAVTAPQVDPGAEKTRGQRFAARVEALRLGLARRIVEAAPGEGGAILAAIVTGKRAAISERADTALQDSGLAHLLAISGLHMGLATGLVFFAVRFGLAAIEPVALRYPIKKWAAAAALASGLFYLILSGGGWSARRAFIMAAIIFAAILVDRRALSLRNVAIAATIILLMTPEALFSPGFQMSFAAVTALIAAYEWWGAREDAAREFSWGAKARRYGIALIVTDLVSATATTPASLFHFNRIAFYSLPANVAAMPLMGFFIMPFAVIALVLTPFGLDGWAWRVAALGMEWVLAIAVWVTSLPGAVAVTPKWPLSAMLTLTFGGLWLCLSRAPWRLAGLASIPLAWIMVAGVRPPVLFVSPTGLNAAVAVEGENGGRRLHVYATRRERFAADLWQETVGLDAEKVRPVAMTDIYACDPSGCAGDVRDKGAVVAAFTADKQALAEDCQRAELVVAFFPVSAEDWRRCDAFLIDRRAAWRRGAHAVWVEEDGTLTVKTANETRGERPWTGD